MTVVLEFRLAENITSNTQNICTYMQINQLYIMPIINVGFCLVSSYFLFCNVNLDLTTDTALFFCVYFAIHPLADRLTINVVFTMNLS